MVDTLASEDHNTRQKLNKGVFTMAYGYLIPSGYMGRLADGSFRKFDTEQEYLDYIAE